MAIGQDVLAPIGVMDRALLVQTRLACDELDRGAAHARILRDVLELHALFSSDGTGIATVSQAALTLSSSKARAAKLLAPRGRRCVSCRARWRRSSAGC